MAGRQGRTLGNLFKSDILFVVLTKTGRGIFVKIINEEVDLGGAGGEAQVKTQFRNIFPGVGGTIMVQQPIMSAWREEFSQTQGNGKKLFLKHLVLKKLDDFFTRTGRYFFPHITRPLGSSNGGDKEGYWYQWVFGRDDFPWEFPGTDYRKEVVGLKEWSKFTSAFEETGINLAMDICVEQGVTSQNIIHEAYKSFEANLNFCWKRIDFGAGSMGIDYDKLCKFFELNTTSLCEVLRPERFALLVMAARYLSGKMTKEYCCELDRLTADYRLSTLKQNTAEILLP